MIGLPEAPAFVSVASDRGEQGFSSEWPLSPSGVVVVPSLGEKAGHYRGSKCASVD